MQVTYTAQYTAIRQGYMGQLLEWPEVITEGETIADCRDLLRDALVEMIAAYRQLGQPIPEGQAWVEALPIEV